MVVLECLLNSMAATEAGQLACMRFSPSVVASSISARRARITINYLTAVPISLVNLR
jgi:hypothetical protein